MQEFRFKNTHEYITYCVKYAKANLEQFKKFVEEERKKEKNNTEVC